MLPTQNDNGELDFQRASAGARARRESSHRAKDNGQILPSRERQRKIQLAENYLNNDDRDVAAREIEIERQINKLCVCVLFFICCFCVYNVGALDRK